MVCKNCHNSDFTFRFGQKNTGMSAGGSFVQNIQSIKGFFFLPSENNILYIQVIRIKVSLYTYHNFLRACFFFFNPVCFIALAHTGSPQLCSWTSSKRLITGVSETSCTQLNQSKLHSFQQTPECPTHFQPIIGNLLSFLMEKTAYFSLT